MTRSSVQGHKPKMENAFIKSALDYLTKKYLHSTTDFTTGMVCTPDTSLCFSNELVNFSIVHDLLESMLLNFMCNHP